MQNLIKRFWNYIGSNATWDATKSVAKWGKGVVSSLIAGAVARWSQSEGFSGSVLFIVFVAAFAVVFYLLGGIFWFLSKRREWKKGAAASSQAESLKIPPAKEKERLNIGCNVASYTDGRGYPLYDITLPITNFGAKDAFMVQVCSVNPPPNIQTLPWSLRWEGGESEFVEIMSQHNRTLHLCRVDLTGELADMQSKTLRPARLWFCTPRENKEVFLTVNGRRGIKDLYNIRILLGLCVTIRSTNERIMYQAEFRFDQGRTEPHCVGIQPL
jgi:hypothetical protein